jgi:hypothetical protein
MWFLLAACAFRPPAETPALVAAEGPVQTLPLPAGEPVRVALRAGSAHDPPGREGLAWVTAHAIAASAGATVEVGPEVIVFSLSAESVPALALALAAPPSPERIAAARLDAAQALADLDCRALAERAWDTWIYTGHPYGHAPEGRLSVLPTLTAQEVAAFQEVRYVRSVAIVGIPAGAPVDPAVFASLPPRLSVSPVPSVRLPLPAAKVLVVTAEGKRCLVAGHPTPAGAIAAPTVDSLLAGPDASAAARRRQPRRLVSLPLPPGFDIAPRVTQVLDGAWLPLWQATRVFAPEATVPAANALGDELLAMHPWPSLARPLVGSTGTTASDVTTGAAPTEPVDALLAAWLTPSETRAVVVLPADEPPVLESLGALGVQAALPAQELFQ